MWHILFKAVETRPERPGVRRNRDMSFPPTDISMKRTYQSLLLHEQIDDSVHVVFGFEHDFDAAMLLGSLD